ncbi:hypothetical protein N7532_002045 [Penicillium argentinense]|uniref:C2 domain-containing protein n=1 Tax=Penicillium argentinense TaxID=1131581 RepID=A0A9W9KMC7_9EURO|nr:uncharacterized protein N7532_002045 [Penicillium argentinense]KAJ5111510.1 hypothetical protein N7532_002045 [Penicillium argentinense]
MSKLTHTKVNHAAGIFADMSVDGPPIGTLVAIIDRAKNLPNRKTMGKQNPYCAARLGKEAKKTPTDLRGGQTPRWDHELRFTVHESPDYYKLKVSVFNDDKKTDLIGETWVDLQNLIIPGGSQNDHWHSLQCRGKYSGDIRIEMTYYDTRQQDEAVIERRKEAAERAQGKAPTTSSSGLSGPRQLNQVKRRPLPTDPSGVTPPRPLPMEKPQSAPLLHHPMPSRPSVREPAQAVPRTDVPVSHPPHPRHSESVYDAPSYEPQHPSMHSRAGYDLHDSYQREWDTTAPAMPPAAPMRRPTHETPYSESPYDSRPLQPRSHSDYDHPPRDYQSTSEPPFEADMRGRTVYEEQAHPHDAYSLVSPQYPANPMTFGHVSTYTPRHAAPMDEPAPLEYSRPSSSSGPGDDCRYQSHNTRALQPVRRRDDYHPEYATMQPRVEDEDEDGPPPPPPVHRSRMAQPAPSQQFVSQSNSPYKPYTPGASPNASHMPASLVAGYESEDAIERQTFGDRFRRPSNHVDDEMMITPSTQPSPASVHSNSRAPSPYESPIHPLRTSPKPLDDRASIASRGSANTETRMVVTRKSVSPRPSSSDSRGGSSIPFSPDSYNSLNPNASRSATSRDPTPAYDSPSQARDAAMRAEIEPVRDLSQPIIGDDGREIDPSDHLPTDTWAPEPERKSRKPEVIIRFKHSPRDRPTSRGNDTAAVARSGGPPRVGFRTEPTTSNVDRPAKRYTPTHVHSSESLDRTPPRGGGQDNYASYSHGRGFTTPTSADRPRSSHRGSVSPSPGSRSPLYDYSPGPPIPSKVPISSGSPSYPVSPSAPNSGNPGMDALSRELKTIDIGSVGCSPSRVVRKYAPPRPSASIGYAS